MITCKYVTADILQQKQTGMQITGSFMRSMASLICHGRGGWSDLCPMTSQATGLDNQIHQEISYVLM